MERWLALLICALCLSSIAAVCTEQEAQRALADGTDYVFSERATTDYVLVLDRSGSMRGGKLEQAKQAAGQLVDELAGGDRAAVIGFDSRPYTYSELTEDQRYLHSAIQAVTLGDFTSYLGALEAAETLWNGNQKVLVFLSDGRPDNDEQALREKTASLTRQGVCIFTIAYAESADEQAQRILQDMASLSQERNDCGGYFRADQNAYLLSQIFSDIYRSVSSEEILSLDVTVEHHNQTALSIAASSALNNKPLKDTCLSPDYEVTILDEGTIIHQEHGRQDAFSLGLAAGDYAYTVRARESCGGACSFTGETSGTFSVNQEQAVCTTPWDQLGTLLTSNEHVEIHITANGFDPQAIGTEGIVVWKNLDDVPHRLVAADKSFRSPVLQPGESWTHVLTPGNYVYTDPTASFQGSLRDEAEDRHHPVDLVLVLDRSGSMAGESLRSAKNAAENLLHVLDTSDRASLVVFSDQARLVQPLTSDIQLLRSAVSGVLSEGSTFYGEALSIARHQLKSAPGDRQQVIIFLSDGAPSDAEGEKGILAAVDEFTSACLYTIGYGEQGVEAIRLLSAMADRSRENNGCGVFYFSRASKDALAGVFGEIYASTQEPGLEIYDVSAPDRVRGSFTITAKVRSAANGLSVPSTSTFGCIPPAEVWATFGSERFPLLYRDGMYRGEITLPAGTHAGTLSARITDPERAARVMVGASPLEVRVSGNAWWLWTLGILVALIAAKLFMGARGPEEYGPV